MAGQLNDQEVEWFATTARALKASRNVTGNIGAGLSAEACNTVHMIADLLHNVSPMGTGDRTFEMLHPPERLDELISLLDRLEEECLRKMTRPPSIISRLRSSVSR